MSAGRLTPWPKISHIHGTGRPTNFKPGKQTEYNNPYHRHARWSQRSPCTHNGTPRPASLTCAMTFKLTALGGCWSHHLQGAGAYWGGNTKDYTACSFSGLTLHLACKNLTPAILRGSSLEDQKGPDLIRSRPNHLW